MGANTIQVPPLRQRCKRWDRNTCVVPEPPWQRFSRKKMGDLCLPLLVQLYFLLCSVWMVCCCRRASCSGVTSLQSAELRRTDSTQRFSHWLLSTAAGRGGRNRLSERCTLVTIRDVKHVSRGPEPVRCGPLEGHACCEIKDVFI